MQGYPRLGKDAPAIHMTACQHEGTSQFPHAGPWLLAFADAWHSEPSTSTSHTASALDAPSALFQLRTPGMMAALDQLGTSLLVIAGPEVWQLQRGCYQTSRPAPEELRAASRAYAVDCNPPTGAFFLVDGNGTLRFAHYTSLGKTPAASVLTEAVLSAWREFSGRPGTGAERNERRISCIASELMHALVAAPSPAEPRHTGTFASTSAAALSS
ncbi:MAG TPA: hypothetical protein VFQ61_32435 [Polyangiaceae bacterium]|nr:hypothetical protein [Polyangiaceae bacterium]